MARAERDRPYSQFNFRVSWAPATDTLGSTGNKLEVIAGFQEVSGLGVEIGPAEYRAGNASTSQPIKITGIAKTPDVTLRRGVIGGLDLYEWLEAIRSGAPNQLKNVSIALMTDDRQAVAQEWLLKNARPMKYTGPSLRADGTDIAIEELVLSAERIEMPG